jgi:uracil-DNA glycosylase family 4
LGRIAAGHLLERPIKITKEHGMINVLPFDESVLVSIIYHPSYVLRNRNTKIEEDFLNDLKDARRVAYGTTANAEVHAESFR